MGERTLQEFLSGFDDSRYPEKLSRDYELLECLSSRPEGETLLVKHRGNGRLYITKCYTDPSLMSSVSEGDLLRGLCHKALPAQKGEYRSDTMLCVVREYIDGDPLDQWMREKPPGEKQVLSIALQLCDILSYLHGQDPPVIHRDIKPQNIIMDEKGKVSLIDFGISRTYDSAAGADTVCYGTKAYAPPEQYGFSQTDSRSDLYALGVLLGVLLTGETDAAKAAGKIRNRRLAAVVKKSTAFEPKNRYKSAEEVKKALSGRITRRRVAFAAALTLLVCLAPFAGGLLARHNHNLRFEEPMIERAVRLMLSKDADEDLTEEELRSVDELYVFGDHAARSEEGFAEFSDHFVANDGTIRRGSIRSLNDLKKLKNLRGLYMVYQNIEDLTPLSKLANLEVIELKHNPIRDISPLSKLVNLNSLGLYDTDVGDLTALADCPRLCVLDIGATEVTSLDAIRGLDLIRDLSACDLPIRSIDCIADHPMLQRIALCNMPLTDLRALLDLPLLQQVELGENMRDAAGAISDNTKFAFEFR